MHSSASEKLLVGYEAMWSRFELECMLAYEIVTLYSCTRYNEKYELRGCCSNVHSSLWLHFMLHSRLVSSAQLSIPYVQYIEPHARVFYLKIIKWLSAHSNLPGDWFFSDEVPFISHNAMPASVQQVPHIFQVGVKRYLPC